MAIKTKEFNRNVFINCPFDSNYQPLLYAIVFAVQIAGFTPRCAKEVSNTADLRLQKIKNIISECKYGIHDISRTELSPNGLPRFNMPLELGIDLGCKEFGSRLQKSKSLLILDRSENRYVKFISDIRGQDPKSHAGNSRRAVNQVRDWLSDQSGLETLPGGDYMFRRYRRFLNDLPALCKAAKQNIKKLTFGDFVKIARVWLEENEQ
jgi:hypothetical protein